MDKIFKFCLEKMPDTNWRRWDEFEKIKDLYVGVLDVTPYCLVFHPEEGQTYIRYFRSENMMWEPGYFDGQKVGTAFKPWEISHWALLPYQPNEWGVESEEYANKCSDWHLGKNERMKKFDDNLDTLKSEKVDRGQGI